MSETAKIEALIADRNLFKGKYRSMAALMESARSQIRQISDHTEDEGDRTYFGSTNHADWLQDLAEEMEAWVIDFELPKGDINKMERDPYAEIRAQRARAEKAEAAISQLHNFLSDFRKFVDLIEGRAMACDGPVTPFLDELHAASDAEKERFTAILRQLYATAPSGTAPSLDKERGE